MFQSTSGKHRASQCWRVLLCGALFAGWLLGFPLDTAAIGAPQKHGGKGRAAAPKGGHGGNSAKKGGHAGNKGHRAKHQQAAIHAAKKHRLTQAHKPPAPPHKPPAPPHKPPAPPDKPPTPPHKHSGSTSSSVTRNVTTNVNRNVTNNVSRTVTNVWRRGRWGAHPWGPHHWWRHRWWRAYLGPAFAPAVVRTGIVGPRVVRSTIVAPSIVKPTIVAPSVVSPGIVTPAGTVRSVDVPPQAIVKQSPPAGPLRIINRKTGRAWKPKEGPLRIEPAGRWYKIRLQDSGQYVAMANWAINKDDTFAEQKPRLKSTKHVSDSESPAMLWEIESLGNGYWSITNCASKKCLEFHDEKSPVRQSPFREGALEQQWRFETVGPP